MRGRKKWMTPEQAKMIKVGDMVMPMSLWNNSDPVNKLACPTEVLEVEHDCKCQTGVMLKVKFLNGKTRKLSAAWFNPKDGSK